MKTKITLLSLITLVALTLSSCGEHAHTENDGHDHGHEKAEAEAGHATDEIVFTKDQAQAAGLKTETVAPGPFTQVIRTSGQIGAGQGDESVIAATSSGIVSYVNAAQTEGSPVSAGQPVFTISARNLVDGDPSAKARIEYESAEREYKRAEGLAKDQIISAKEFEQARVRFETAKAAYQGVRGNGSGVTVTSPISGFIKNQLVSQGQFVSTGQPVATVSRNKQLQLRAEVSERYFNQLPSVQSANFKLPYSDRIYKLSDLNGRLLSFGKTSGENSFYVPVTFSFDNVGDIVSGSFAEIYLLSAPREQVVSVPVSALSEEQGVYYVYVRLDDEGFRKQEVKTGQNNGERIEILSGLKNGDQVVVTGTTQVKLAASSSAIPEGHNH